MITTAKLFRSTIVLSALVILQACSGNAPIRCDDCPGSSRVNNVPVNTAPVKLGIVSYQPEKVVATDLVNAMAQAPNFDKQTSILKIPSSNSTFMSALRDVLIERGYRVQASGKRAGKGVLMVSSVKEKSHKGLYTYMVAVDRLALKRTYMISNRKIRPASSLYVRGVSPSLISLNDGLFVN